VHFGASEVSKEDAEKTVQTFKKFIEDNKDEIIALQIIYSIPYKKRFVTYEQIKELTNALTKPPYNLSSLAVWRAYKLLDSSRVKGTPDKQLTNIISLVKYTIGQTNILEPFPLEVEERFTNWVSKKQFSDEQLKWLRMIKDSVASSATFEMSDFEDAPFFDFGGTYKAAELFGDQLPNVIDEVNMVLFESNV
jgi:type I restriction enzyme R subunit